MDKQHLRLFEVAQDNFSESTSAHSLSAPDQTGFDFGEPTPTTGMRADVIEAEEVAADIAPPDEELKFTPEDEAKIDRLAETHHNYGDAYRLVAQEVRRRTE